MSSGFSGGFPDFFNVKGACVNNVAGRLMNYRSPLAGILSESISPVSELIGKRSLAEFQQQQQFRQQASVYLRNVKPRVYNQHPDLSFSPEVSSISTQSLANQEIERNMLNRLHELEKELLFDDDEEELENDNVSVVTNTEWSETIQNLLNPVHSQKPDNNNTISPSPTTSSSSSSCASSTSLVSPKQLISEAAEAITDGKTETATELITRLNQISYARGTPEERIGFYMASAFSSRACVTSTPTELYRKDHILSTQLLYGKSPCFKLAFMAANDVIMQTISGSDRSERNIHIVDFDIGHGLQYVYLLHEIAAARDRGNRTPISLRLTTFKDFGNGGVERLKLVGDGLKSLSNKLGVFFYYNVLDFKLSEITKNGLMVENRDVLAVNFAFKLNKLPDESVTVNNLRDDVLRRVKGLSPAVVMVAEQELNGNTASFTTRVNDVFSYYKTLLDSFDATIPRDHPERMKIEEGLSRRIVNSIACEGRDRVERCEVFGKWRARMRMAGFDSKPVSQFTRELLLSKLNSGTRGNPGFTVKEDSGGIRFGWLGRTLTVVSAWC